MDVFEWLCITIVVLVILTAAIVPPVLIFTRRKKRARVPTSVPSNIPSNISLSGGIERCPGGSPGDAAACSFEPDSKPPTFNFTLSIVGTPQGNCYGNSTTTFTIGGRAAITRQWSQSYNSGVRFPFLDVGGGYSWSSSVAYEVDQSTTIVVSAGDQVALVLKVPTSVTTGRMLMRFSHQVNSSSYWYINNITFYQPIDSPIYDNFHLPCGQYFNLSVAPLRLPATPRTNNALHTQYDLSAFLFLFVIVFRHLFPSTD